MKRSSKYFLLGFLFFLIPPLLVFYPYIIIEIKLFLGYPPSSIVSEFIDQNLFSMGHNYQDVNQDELKIIGCGAIRTGTYSTKLALEELGYNVYHGVVSEVLKHDSIWANILRDPDALLDHMVDVLLKLGINATLDWPVSFICLELYKRFPNAKVLLNVRDSAEQWRKSLEKLLYFEAPLYNHHILLDIFGLAAGNVKWKSRAENGGFTLYPKKAQSIFPWVNYIEKLEFDEKLAEEKYLEHIETVKRTVPAENLLVFNVKQGWEPLAKFLGVEAPSPNFPRANKGGDELKRVGNHSRFLFVVFPLLVFMWIVGAGLVLKGVVSLLCFPTQKKKIG